MPDVNVECENINQSWNLDLNKICDDTKAIFDFYMSKNVISDKCCLKDYQYKSVSFDILFCDGVKTHEINKLYRGKDYPADIITFAVFADSPPIERFIIEGDINLGEIIIALDKIEESAVQKGISKHAELEFFIAHGILHLLGFDHQTDVEYNFVVKYQIDALESLNIKYDKV